jgi:hypothetical protein
MGLGDAAAPLVGMVSGSVSRLARYWWVLFIFVGIAIMVAGIWIYKTWKAKKSQWTHILIVRRVLQNNLLSKPYEHKMRRFPLIKRAEVFELEKALLGGYLLPELDKYSGVNEFSIIIDKNNRIYTNQGEYFDPDKNSVNVSAKHSEIDIARANLRAEFQNVNKTNKRIEWATIAKYAMYSLLIIAVMIVSIVGLGEWGDSHDAKANAADAQAQAMRSLAESLDTNEATVNTQVLMIDKLNELYGSKNIQRLIRDAKNETA